MEGRQREEVREPAVFLAPQNRQHVARIPKPPDDQSRPHSPYNRTDLHPRSSKARHWSRSLRLERGFGDETSTRASKLSTRHPFLDSSFRQFIGDFIGSRGTSMARKNDVKKYRDREMQWNLLSLLLKGDQSLRNIIKRRILIGRRFRVYNLIDYLPFKRQRYLTSLGYPFIEKEGKKKNRSIRSFSTYRS